MNHIQWEKKEALQPTKQLKDLMAGIPFQQTAKPGRIYLRVKPTDFLLNSNIVGDVLNRGDCLVASLHQPCTLSVMKGNTEVDTIAMKITIL